MGAKASRSDQATTDRGKASDGREIAAFSPVEDAHGSEPLLRWQRRIGLVPAPGLGIARRALVLTAVAWLPLVLWALWTGRFWHGAVADPLLQHFSVHARFLVAIPLLLIGEALLKTTLLRLTHHLDESGLVAASERSRYLHQLRRLAHWRNAALPQLTLFALVIAWTILDRPDPTNPENSWTLLAEGRLGFGAYWIGYVARPILAVLLLAWVWRWFLVVVLFAQLGRLDLRLTPTHPDHVGGLFFLQELPKAWFFLTLAVSVVIACDWAHAVLYHGAALSTFKWQAGIFVVGWTALLLIPLATMAPLLIRTKSRARARYGDLVRRHGQLVHRRWIEGEQVEDDGLLDAPEIGPVADAAAMYESVAAMHITLIGKRALVLILLPLILPLLAVTLLEVPLSTEVVKLLKVLL